MTNQHNDIAALLRKVIPGAISMGWISDAEAAALSSAGRVQQAEPVAWANGDELDNMLDDRVATVAGAKSGQRTVALYLAAPAASAPAPAVGEALAPEYIGLEKAAQIVESTKVWKGGGWNSTLSPETNAAIAATLRAAAQEASKPVQAEAPSDLGSYGHRCPAVTGHRGPTFICQGSGERVAQDSYCEKCTCPAARALRAADSVRVACISLEGVTLTIPAKVLIDLGMDYDERPADDPYHLTFKTMTRAEFDALGEFDGF